MKQDLLLTDEQIIKLIRSGNNDCFAILVERHQKPIGRYLYRLTEDYDVAQDLTQDTFIKAYQGIVKTDSELNIRPWLYRIATNALNDYFRRQKVFYTFVNNEYTPQVSTGSDIEDKLIIEETFSRIPRKKKMCMALHFIEGFNYREIADIAGITVEAVRKRVARGSKEFRRLYMEVGKYEM